MGFLCLSRYMWNGKLSSAPITIQIGVFAYSITIALMNWTSWTRLFYRGFMEGMKNLKFNLTKCMCMQTWFSNWCFQLLVCYLG